MHIHSPAESSSGGSLQPGASDILRSFLLTQYFLFLRLPKRKSEPLRKRITRQDIFLTEYFHPE